MADKIDQLKIGTTSYDIDLPPDATPVVASLETTKLKVPTTSGSSTCGVGSNGQVIKSNGTTVYWASDNNSDTKATQTITTSSNTSVRPVLMGMYYGGNTPTAAQTFGTTTAACYSAYKTWIQPSTGEIYVDQNKVIHTGNIATTSGVGVVKSTTTGTQASRDYYVQVNTDGTMKVNVPWSSGSDTWREIQVDSTQKIASTTSTALNFVSQDASNGDVSFTYNSGIKATAKMPTALKNPQALTIKGGNTALGNTYDGENARTYTFSATPNTNGSLRINDGTNNVDVQLAGAFTDNDTKTTAGNSRNNGTLYLIGVTSTTTSSSYATTYGDAGTNGHAYMITNTTSNKAELHAPSITAGDSLHVGDGWLFDCDGYLSSRFINCDGDAGVTLTGDVLICNSNSELIDYEPTSGSPYNAGQADLVVTGNIYATYFYAGSDIRLKENIEDTSLNYNEILDSLHVIDFNYKADPDKKLTVGLIAQELEAALPEKYHDSFIQIKHKDENNYLNINEVKLTYIALLALKDQRQQIKELTKKVEKLEKLINEK